MRKKKIKKDIIKKDVVVVSWQASTKTWIIHGAIGFRRHPTKAKAVAEATEYCRGTDLTLSIYTKYGSKHALEL